MEKAIRKYSSNDKLFAFLTSFSRKPTTTTSPTSNNMIACKVPYPDKTTEAAADSAASDHYFPIGFNGGEHDTSGRSYPVGTADGGTMHSAATDVFYLEGAPMEACRNDGNIRCDRCLCLQEREGDIKGTTGPITQPIYVTSRWWG